MQCMSIPDCTVPTSPRHVARRAANGEEEKGESEEGEEGKGPSQEEVVRFPIFDCVTRSGECHQVDVRKARDLKTSRKPVDDRGRRRD
jgi:hypothetical protein